MKKAWMILAMAAMAFAPAAASAAVRVRIGIGGPVVYTPPGWYNPFWGAYWGPGPYYAFPNAGEVKLDTKVKDAQVFIDGSYAGTTKQNRTMHLRPGQYTIEIQENGQTPFSEQVYVMAGKTIRLEPQL